MNQDDIISLKRSVLSADIFALVYAIIFLILFFLKIATLDNIMGIIIGYISVRIVYTRQIIKFQNESVEFSYGMIWNLFIYVTAMVIMMLISTSTFITGILLILIYRNIVLFKLRSFTNKGIYD